MSFVSLPHCLLYSSWYAWLRAFVLSLFVAGCCFCGLLCACFPCAVFCFSLLVHTHIHLTPHNQGKVGRWKSAASFPPLFSSVLLLLDEVGPDQIPPFLKPLGRRDGADVDGDEVKAGGVELEGEEVGPNLFLRSCMGMFVYGGVRWRSALGVRA